MNPTYYIKTSISLPNYTLEKLSKKIFGYIKSQDLAIFCLKKYLRRLKISNFNPKATCTYNTEACKAKLIIWLTEKEHYNLKVFRILTGKSVSFMVYLAIEKFLEGFLRIMGHFFKQYNKMSHQEWYNILRNSISGIHRKIKFIADGGRGFFGLMIVMPKPSAKWPLRFQKMKVRHENWRKYII